MAFNSNFGSELFYSLDQQLQEKIGHKLFTATRILPSGDFVERIYSTQPETYAIYGQKPNDKDDVWSKRMEQGEIFHANHPDEFGDHFFDLDVIVSLGLGAVINIPIIDNGQNLGSLNLLHSTGSYPTVDVDAINAIYPTAIKAFRDYEASL